MDLSTFFRQSAIYWAPGNNDGFGQRTMADPVDLLTSIRWEDVRRQYRDAQGTLQVSETTVFSTTKLEVGGYIALVDPTTYPLTANAATAAGARFSEVSAQEIRHRGVSPSLHLDTTLYEYML